MAGNIQEAFRNIPNHEGPLKRGTHKITGVTIVATDKSSASVLERSPIVTLHDKKTDGKKRKS